jgi:hypothetical protein
MATSGLGVLTEVSVAQQSPEIMETIGHSYKIGRVTTADGMILQTVLYNGAPIAIDYILPVGGALAPGGHGPSEFAGTVLSGEVSANYFVLHRARSDGSIIHEIFLDGESLGNVLEAAAVNAMQTARRSSPQARGTRVGQPRQHPRNPAGFSLIPLAKFWLCALSSPMGPEFALRRGAAVL